MSHNKTIADIPSIDVEIRVGDDHVFARDVLQDISVNSATLDESIEKQSTLYAYYSMMWHKAQTAQMHAEHDYEVTWAEVFKESKLSFRDMSTRGPSDHFVQQMCRQHPQIQEKKQAVIEAQEAASILWSFCKALEQKKDMILRLAYQQGKELAMTGMSSRATTIANAASASVRSAEASNWEERLKAKTEARENDE